MIVRHFKAFEHFRLDLRGSAYLAGPNNAGKSTLISAIRVTAQMVRIARRRNPSETFFDGPDQVIGYAFNAAQVGLDETNLRHEFREVETRISTRFKNGAVVVVIWPAPATGDDPFFYLQQGNASVNNVRQVRDAFPEIGVVPVLSPVDDQEEALTPKYVREQLDGRLASRHFRNQLLLLRDEGTAGQNLTTFLEFAEPWLPELKINRLGQHIDDGKVILDLYYREPGWNAPKEIVWAGDGMQIWLQLLLHVFRHRNREVIVLDEPDVFLHPDLQRKLVSLLDSLGGQTITATHSSEVLTEAPAETVVWIEKSRRRSVSAPRPAQLTELSRALGSQFNIRLARALRAQTVLFVEGEDAKILRHVARTVGASQVATESGIAVIPLRGFDNWNNVQPFTWMADNFLDGSVSVFVLLDRDYRTESESRAVRARLRDAGATCHVWKRKELESYLLHVAAIARLSGASDAFVEAALEESASELADEVLAQVTAEALRRLPHDQHLQAVREAKTAFDAAWGTRAERPFFAPPTLVLAGVNRRLQTSGSDAVSFQGLSREIHASEVPHEMTDFLERVEAAINAQGGPHQPR